MEYIKMTTKRSKHTLRESLVMIPFPDYPNQTTRYLIADEDTLHTKNRNEFQNQ